MGLSDKIEDSFDLYYLQGQGDGSLRASWLGHVLSQKSRLYGCMDI